MNTLETVFSLFQFQGELVSYAPYGNGHINETYLITTSKKRYILQKINTHVFGNVPGMMNNISGVTRFIKEKMVAENKDPERYSLMLIPTKAGKDYLDNELGAWRGYNFIENSVSLEQAESSQDFYKSGLGFGSFQYMLKEYDASTLTETIKDFHNTVVRFENFKKAVKADTFGRAKTVAREIEFFMEHELFYGTLLDKCTRGELPVRVTHNDTKLNNVMLDQKTREPICVIDLDTVMPGLSAYDFGDSIRFGASTGAEDEKDLDKIGVNLEYYEAYVKGFLKGLRGSLTKEELLVLPVGARMMTIECGMRFLTDYLSGDVYFRIAREEQNLDRARTQIKLFKDLVAKEKDISKLLAV